MNTLFIGAALAATLALPQMASADWMTQFGVGVFGSDRVNTDTDIEGSPFVGGYLDAYGSTTFANGLRFAVDGRIEIINDQGRDDPYVTGPVHSGVFGVHLGRDFGPAYVGGFAAYGLFDGYDSDAPMSGWMAGIEAERAFSDTVTGYVQVAYIEAIGDPGDNEFIGYNANIGGKVALNDRLDLGLGLETAYSPECFEDCSGDWGRSFGAVINATYAVNDLVGVTAGIRHQAIVANTEDFGADTSVFLGVTLTPGRSKPTSSLRTPIGGFVAAGWMEPLD